MKIRNIIIDTDPGIDDAAALVIAMQNPELNVMLLSTVAANVEVEKTTLNALRLVEFLGADVPVARGCGEPLMIPLDPCPEVHGESGMEGYDFPPVTSKPLAKHAVEVMREMILDSEEKITLVPIAGLTNIALLFKMYPEVKENIDEIVLMGGGLSGGNTNTSAEFNFYVDPHAAKIVLDCGLPITMVGLDVTLKALVGKECAETMRDSGRAGKMLYTMFMHYNDGTALEEEGLRIHDASAIAYLLKPEMFTTEMRYIDVATEGPAAGTTVWDPKRSDRWGAQANVNVCIDVDSQMFEEWFAGEFCR